MTPDYDRQTNPRWPSHLDNPTHRARRIAGMYRALLNSARPDLCRQADETAASKGETWMLERETLIDPDREVTAAEAAELVNVPPNTLHKWAALNHPDEPDRPLLPRYGKRGRERTFIAGKVLEAAAVMRRAQHADGG
ncbi:hypothetical protein [Micromonospora profundi]|uniref:hypothetical protein n=1 Tax=Micromonospora profundi TaxID=1420889 RepID=UPI003669CA33